ncbi:MAG: Crp/Fnr family transcriptional regulator [Chloroflexaceae bacterium]
MISDSEIHYVDAGDIFRNLAPEQREQIERLLSYKTYPAGQIFHSPDEYGEQLFVLRSGQVRLYKLSTEGRALTLAVLEAITIFGEMTLVGQWMHDTFAEAITECTIGIIDREALRQILENYPQVALSFMEIMGQRLHAIENKLADIAFKSVPQRLASVLLNLANISGVPKQTDTPPSVMRYTHQQLAEMVGSYRETVTKAMGEFREAGLIRVEEETVYLTDLEELQRLANR